MNIYCGNNALDQSLTSGEKIIGNRYDCLRKGIAIGKNLPKYTGEYQKIDNRKIFCGKSNILPNTHDYLGNLPMCLSKGVGIGRSRFSFNKHSFTYVFYIILFGISFFLLSLILYKIKPAFVRKNKISSPNWLKIILFSFLISTLITFTTYHTILYFN